jgi:hypothetical protein
MKDTSKHVLEEMQYSLLPDESKKTTTAEKTTAPAARAKTTKNSEDNKVKNLNQLTDKKKGHPKDERHIKTRY